MKHIGCPDSTRRFVNFINSSVTDNRDGGYGYLNMESGRAVSLRVAETILY